MTTNQLIANQRKSLILFAQRSGNIAKACRVFGVSRTTYYELKKQFLRTGTLEPLPRPKPLMPNRTRISAKKALLRLIQEHPAWGPRRLSYRLKEQGIVLSEIGVYYHLKRFKLKTRWKRLVYIEKLNARQGLFTQRTLKLLHQAKERHIEADWPGDLVGVDTFYVGHLKGVGRIYQQTAIDCFSRFGFAHLYTRCDHRGPTHFIEQVVLPSFFQHRVQVERVLTDRGTEYCNYVFDGMLSHYEIPHVLTKPRRPQSNGITERFQRTILEEFYQKAFRTKIYTSLEQLQNDLNDFLTYYNHSRHHQSLKGKCPVAFFRPNLKTTRQRFGAKLLT